MLPLDFFMNKMYKLKEYESILFIVEKEIDIKDLIKIYKYLPHLKKTICSSKKLILNKIRINLNDEDTEYLFNHANSLFRLSFCDDNVSTISEEVSINNYDIIIFSDNTNIQVLRQVKGCRPKIIIGSLKEKDTDYYDVWQEYKNISDLIFLLVFTRNGEKEILNWEKDDNPIEISIVLPIYNVEQYLVKCIDRLRQWDVDYFEIIAVNDGSPDGSLSLLKKLNNQDNRIVIVDKPNGGCASARQKGLELAKGKYVGFVDPDDFTTPDMFYLLHRRAILGNYDVCYGGYYKYYEKSGKHAPVKTDAIYAPYKYGSNNISEIQNLICDLRVAIWRGIYKKTFLTNNNINFNINLPRFDDLPFKIEVMAKAGSVVCLKDFLYYYRLERPGQDVAVDDKRLFVHFDIFEYLDKKIVTEMDEERITDLIQIVKLDTHYWAIKKIRKKYRREYHRRAKLDLKNNMGYFRYLLCCWNYRGKKYIVKAILFSLGITNIRRAKRG